MKRFFPALAVALLTVWSWPASFSGLGLRAGDSGHPRPAFAQERAARAVDFDKLVEKIPVGDVLPARCVIDPHAVFNGVAVDSVNDLVVMTAPNIRSLLLYKRSSGRTTGEVTRPLGQVIGPATHVRGVAGVAVDPVRKEFYGIETDIGDNVAAFSYHDRGDAEARTLAIPIGGWGISLNQARNEMAVSIEDNDQLMVFRRGARGIDKPLRQIRGIHSLLADPKGLSWDDKNHEIVVANEGNWSRSSWDPDYSGGGEYRPPSIVVFDETADKDARPRRIIQGDKTRLDFPHGLAVDNIHDEIAVANDGDNSVLIFSRTASGNAAPIRIIGGANTEIERPMGLAFDAAHDELWVANWGHSAEVFDRAASGDVKPKRVIRSAPPGTPVAGLSNIPALGFDSRRDQLLAPN